MKNLSFQWKFLFLFPMIYCLGVPLNAQQCEVINSSNGTNVSSDIRFAYNQGPFLVKLYIHILRKGDGTGGITEEGARTAVGILNEDFNPQNIYFQWEDCAIRYIDDDVLFEAGEDAPLRDTIFSTNSIFTGAFRDSFHTDGIDLFLLDAYLPAAPNDGPTGYATSENNWSGGACITRGTLYPAPQITSSGKS